MKINVVNNSNNPLPEYAYKGDAGMDLRADIEHINPDFMFDCSLGEDYILIKPGGRALIPTGLHVSLPEGYEIQIRPRSGLALKKGITCLNSPGTIDCNYRGDIGVILYNASKIAFLVSHGDRIAQAVLNKVENIDFNLVENLDETDRNEAGFGSSNIN